MSAKIAPAWTGRYLRIQSWTLSVALLNQQNSIGKQHSSIGNQDSFIGNQDSSIERVERCSLLQNDEFCVKNDEFCIQNDEFYNEIRILPLKTDGDRPICGGDISQIANIIIGNVSI